jgi:tetratricopeptide (TPR) repeat protein
MRKFLLLFSIICILFTNALTQQNGLKTIEDYNNFIKLNPDNAEAYYNRGCLYHDLIQIDLAIKDLSKAIELNPKYAEAYYHRGNTYSDNQQFDLAIKDFSKAIELNPNNSEAYYRRGILNYGVYKRFDLAVKDYSKAIELKPNFSGAYLNRSLAYKALGKIAKAEADIKKYFELTGTKTIESPSALT